jgi:hypothetical protein
MGICCLVYGLVARHAGWMASTAAGLATFVICLAVLSRITPSLFVAFLVVCAALTVAALALPRSSGQRAPVTAPWWDLLARMVVAAAVVLTLTTSATYLGPTLSGLFSPIPVFLFLLAIFAQRAEGADASIRVLRGGIMGSFAFAVFFLIVGIGLGRLGIGATYVLASVGSIALNGAVLSVGRGLFR